MDVILLLSPEKFKETKKKKNLYDSDYASLKLVVRRKNSKYQGMKIMENRKIEEYIVEKIEQGWSPDIISGRMKIENKFYVNKDL